MLTRTPIAQGYESDNSNYKPQGSKGNAYVFTSQFSLPKCKQKQDKVFYIELAPWLVRTYELYVLLQSSELREFISYFKDARTVRPYLLVVSPFVLLFFCQNQVVIL